LQTTLSKTASMKGNSLGLRFYRKTKLMTQYQLSWLYYIQDSEHTTKYVGNNCDAERRKRRVGHKMIALPASRHVSYYAWRRT